MKLSRRGQEHNQYPSDEEQVLVSGMPKHQPCVKLFFFQADDSETGRLLFEVCHDCENIPIDHFEVFLAGYRKLIEVATRKAADWEVDDQRDFYTVMPQVEMNYNNQSLAPSPVSYSIRDWDGPFNIPTARKFADVMEKLLAEGRTIEGIEINEKNR